MATTNGNWMNSEQRESAKANAMRKIWVYDGHPQFEVIVSCIDVDDLTEIFAGLSTIVTGSEGGVRVCVTLDEDETKETALEVAGCVADKMRMRKVEGRFADAPDFAST